MIPTKSSDELVKGACSRRTLAASKASYTAIQSEIKIDPTHYMWSIHTRKAVSKAYYIANPGPKKCPSRIYSQKANISKPEQKNIGSIKIFYYSRDKPERKNVQTVKQCPNCRTRNVLNT